MDCPRHLYVGMAFEKHSPLKLQEDLPAGIARSDEPGCPVQALQAPAGGAIHAGCHEAQAPESGGRL